MENAVSVDGSGRWPQAAGTERLSAWMRGQGFAPGTITEYQRRARLLGAWLCGRRIGPSELTEGIAAEFGAAMRAAGHADLTVRGAVRLVAYLEESGAVSRREPRAGQIPPGKR